MSVRECTIDYLIQTTCIYICVFNMLHFMCLFTIMSISVKQHELWCTVRDICLSKCSIIIILNPRLCPSAIYCLRRFSRLSRTLSTRMEHRHEGCSFYGGAFQKKYHLQMNRFSVGVRYSLSWDTNLLDYSITS